MLNTKEAAKFLGMKESTLRSWRCKGIGPRFYTPSSRKAVYAESDLQQWMAERLCVPVPHTTGRYAALQTAS